MDIFLRNVPEQINEKGLRNHLQPFLSKFHIKTFKCHKAKGKCFANLIIADQAKAERFLATYEQPQTGRLGPQHSKPKLFVMNRAIAVHRGRRAPGQFVVSSLEREEKERTKSLNDPNYVRPSQQKGFRRTYAISELYCGQWDYEGDHLVYSSYYELHKASRLCFGSRKIFVDIPESRQISTVLEIPYHSVHSYITGSNQDPSFTFSLTTAPKIFKRIRTETSTEDMQELISNLSAVNLNESHDVVAEAIMVWKKQLTPGATNGRSCRELDHRTRLPAIDQRHQYVAANCLCYRFKLKNADEISAVHKLRQLSEIPDSVPYPTHFSRHRSFASQMTRLNTLLAGPICRNVAFELKFQMRKLAQNGYLGPDCVSDLIEAMVPLISQDNHRNYVQAFHALFGRLPYRGPDADAYIFTVENLRATLEQGAARSDAQPFFQDLVDEYDHLVAVHKVTVTPTGMYLEGPTPEIKNRVLRKYSAFPNNFLSVSFHDEDFQNLHHDQRTSATKIFRERFKTLLEGVINIAGQPFEVRHPKSYPIEFRE